MKFRFANLLPALDSDDQVDAKSPVRVLLRGVNHTGLGDRKNAAHYFEVATALYCLGYARTALVYFALGRGRKDEHTLLLETDGFAFETAKIINASRGWHPRDSGELHLAHNPSTGVTFVVVAGTASSREVLFSGVDCSYRFLYQENNSFTQSGILQVIDAVFNDPIDVLLERGQRNRQRSLNPPKPDLIGQQEFFVSC